VTSYLNNGVAVRMAVLYLLLGDSVVIREPAVGGDE
jgi:aspartate carbamoyltransferase catalytic subunit